MNIDDRMNKCIDIKNVSGVITIKCKLGFWSVSGRDQKEVVSDARHYFGQYLSDGEYHELVGGKSPLQILMSQSGRT